MNPQSSRDPRYNRPVQPVSRTDADYQAASQATAEDDYDDYMSKGQTYTAPKHIFRKVLIGLLIVVLVGGAGYGVYWYLNHKGTKKPAAKASTSSQTTTSQSTISTQTKHYSSSEFNLEFNYPADWTITDTTGSGVLTARSPSVKLKDTSGQTMTGQVILTIRNKQQPLPEFDKGNAVAVLPSQKINYTSPSQAQRAATYISFLQYASTTAASALDGVYITGDVGYQKDQAIPKADIAPIDPVIDVVFAKCTDSSCNNGTTASIASTMWNDSTFAGPITKMLQSLTIN
jgi:hypothetical protein